MKTSIIISAVFCCSLVASGGVSALPVSSTDLWQDAPLVFSSPGELGGNGSSTTGVFDGLQGSYGTESGNSIFRGGADGSSHSIEWSTPDAVTVRSINFVTYHDFDDQTHQRDITSRGIRSFTLSYWDGSDFESFFHWTYTDPNNDLHYGGGPSYQFNPDPNDMTRSYLELTANLDSAITAQTFKGDFVQYGPSGSRIVELDAYSTPQVIPLPATLMLFITGLLGVASVSKARLH
jgi:hypothetical protein